MLSTAQLSLSCITLSGFRYLRTHNPGHPRQFLCLLLWAVEHENAVASIIRDLSVIDWHTARTPAFLSPTHVLLLPFNSPISGLNQQNLRLQ